MVTAQYFKREDFRYDPEYHGTRETLWEAGGKGEKNPGRGVKENLKPCTYKL